MAMLCKTEVCLTQVLYCDVEPDCRAKATERLSELGYGVLATGNPQIAAAIAQEKPLGALVVSSRTANLALLSLLREMRQQKPSLPILFILEQCGGLSVPSGLADILLISPTDRAISQALRALTSSRRPDSLAC